MAEGGYTKDSKPSQTSMGKVIGGLVVVIVLLVGIFYWWNRNQTPGTRMQEQAAELSPDSGSMTASEKSTTSGMMSSIKEAMGLGKKMNCTYSDTTNGKTVQSEVVVDGEKFKSTTMMEGLTVYAVFDGTTQYTWTSKEKQGSKITKACMEEFQGAATNAAPAEDKPTSVKDDFMAGFDAAQNVSCKPALTTDFSIPTDITFTDQCAVMKQGSEMMQRLKGDMPNGAAGGNIPSVPAPNTQSQY